MPSIAGELICEDIGQQQLICISYEEDLVTSIHRKLLGQRWQQNLCGWIYQKVAFAPSRSLKGISPISQ